MLLKENLCHLDPEKESLLMETITVLALRLEDGVHTLLEVSHRIVRGQLSSFNDFHAN
jgi:hypothetical protein